MPTEFEKKVADFISETELFVSGGKVLLALSGGADSTALLYALTNLAKEKILKNKFLCAHINHRLRGSESDADEEFAAGEAVRLDLPIITRRIDVLEFSRQRKISIETAGRQLRIENLIDIAKENNCKWIATAHHKDDNAETMVQRLARGTGFRGLGGIWPAKEFTDGITFVRPLLNVSRGEIVDYLKEKNLPWRQDRTNNDCIYRRNFIRHRLIPFLQKDCSVSIADSLFELSRHSQGFYRRICLEADRLWGRLAKYKEALVSMEAEVFAKQPRAVKAELVRRSLSYLGSGERDLTQQHFKRIFRLAGADAGVREIILPGGFKVYRQSGELVFAKIVPGPEHTGVRDESRQVQVPGETAFNDYIIEAKVLEGRDKGIEKFKTEKNRFVERFDFDKLKGPLIIRFRKQGDKFLPIGLAGEKRVGKFLTAAKLSTSEREKILIVTDSEKIAWVWPMRMSEKVKISSGTRRVLELRITGYKGNGQYECDRLQQA